MQQEILQCRRYLKLKKVDGFTQSFAQKVSIKCTSLMDTVSTLSFGNQQMGCDRKLLASCARSSFSMSDKGRDVAEKIEIFNIINEWSPEEIPVVIVSRSGEIIGCAIGPCHSEATRRCLQKTSSRM
jgi:ABC-type sugar transport system ATPase subunit